MHNDPRKKLLLWSLHALDFQDYEDYRLIDRRIKGLTHKLQNSRNVAFVILHFLVQLDILFLWNNTILVR